MLIPESGGGDDDIPLTESPKSQKRTTTADTESESTRFVAEDAGLSQPSPSQVENGVSKIKTCGVCNEKESKYKCSRCLLPYCSVACSTLHKATHPAIDSTPGISPKESPPPCRSNSLSLEALTGTVGAANCRSPFAALEGSSKLKALFEMYPKLSSQLDEIYKATLPSSDYCTEDKNNQPPRRRAGGEGRGGRRGVREPWNRHHSIQNGVQALCQAREAYGTDGEGVREYSRLVLEIMSGDESSNATQLIQRELADENARIISQLLNGES